MDTVHMRFSNPVFSPMGPAIFEEKKNNPLKLGCHKYDIIKIVEP